MSFSTTRTRHTAFALLAGVALVTAGCGKDDPTAPSDTTPAEAGDYGSLLNVSRTTVVFTTGHSADHRASRLETPLAGVPYQVYGYDVAPSTGGRATGLVGVDRYPNPTGGFAVIVGGSTVLGYYQANGTTTQLPLASGSINATGKTYPTTTTTAFDRTIAGYRVQFNYRIGSATLTSAQFATTDGHSFESTTPVTMPWIDITNASGASAGIRAALGQIAAEQDLR